MEVVNREGGNLNHPGVCVFTGTSDGDLIDTGFWLNAKDLDGVDPYGYVSVGFVKNMAKEIGMVDGAEVERLRERCAKLEDESNEVHRQLDALTTLEEVLA